MTPEECLVEVERLIAAMSRETYVWRMWRHRQGGLVPTNKALMRAALAIDAAARAYVKSIEERENRGR